MNERQEKRFLHQRMGPGGPKCYCCRFRSTGAPKTKRRFTRMVKRSLKNRLRRFLKNHETP